MFIAWSHKDSQNFFMHFFSLNTSCFFSIFLNENIVDIENTDGICCSPAFFVNEFSGLFLHQSVFSIKH